MAPMQIRPLVVAFLAGLSLVPVARAADPAAVCAASKWTASMKNGTGKLKYAAKAAATGSVPFANPTTLATLDGKLTDAFTKAEGKGGCLEAGTADQVRTDADLYVGLFRTIVGGGGMLLAWSDPSPLSKCGALQLKAVAKGYKGEIACRAKAVKQGLGIAFDPLCESAVHGKLAQTVAKAALGSDCRMNPSVELDVLVDTWVLQLLDREPTPIVCGNGRVEWPELCDPPGTCPTSCDDGLTCTTDTLVGTPATCDARCEFVPIYDDLGLTARDTCTGLEWEKKTGAEDDTPGNDTPNPADLHDVDNRYNWTGGYWCQPTLAASDACKAQVPVELWTAAGCDYVSGGSCIVDPEPFWQGDPITTVWDWLAQLNASNFAGHADWRLPTSGGWSDVPSGQPAELESLHAVPAVGPIGYDYDGTRSIGYWSASLRAGIPEFYAWQVILWPTLGPDRQGAVDVAQKFSPHFVRAVR